ncbi:MAG: hypothetical protein QOG45_910 [Chloroflexota bacterium]|nr:hypothetical protein [Chloroflexota bacterium]
MAVSPSAASAAAAGTTGTRRGAVRGLRGTVIASSPLVTLAEMRSTSTSSGSASRRWMEALRRSRRSQPPSVVSDAWSRSAWITSQFWSTVTWTWSGEKPGTEAWMTYASSVRRMSRGSAGYAVGSGLRRVR